ALAEPWDQSRSTGRHDGVEGEVRAEAPNTDTEVKLTARGSGPDLSLEHAHRCPLTPVASNRAITIPAVSSRFRGVCVAFGPVNSCSRLVPSRVASILRQPGRHHRSSLIE